MVLPERSKYFLSFLLILIIEMSIALFVKNHFIRGTVGDFLVVFLIYLFLQSIFQAKPIFIGFITLSIAFIVEFSQLLNIVRRLDLDNNKIASTIMGTTFSVYDLVAYVLGCFAVYFLDKMSIKRR